MKKAVESLRHLTSLILSFSKGRTCIRDGRKEIVGLKAAEEIVR
jgi:hypothetical protein